MPQKPQAQRPARKAIAEPLFFWSFFAPLCFIERGYIFLPMAPKLPFAQAVTNVFLRKAPESKPTSRFISWAILDLGWGLDF